MVMKIILFISLAGMISNGVLGQCPTPGLQIQSEACEPPTHLKLNTRGCTQIEASWVGNKNQAYAIKASFTDFLTNRAEEATTSEITCDNNGNYRATVSVKEGTTVNFS